MKLKDRFIRFMYGRYGVDSFGKFTIWGSLILMLIAGWTHRGILSLRHGPVSSILFPDVFQKYLQTSRRESEISADDTRHPDIFLQAA